MRILTIVGAAALFIPTGEVVELPRQLEVELARSALPDHLRADATIYVFDPDQGYRVEVEGSNGFHALVGRDDPAIRWASFTLDDYPTDFLIPVAFDSAGHDAQLKAYLDLGRWRAQGVPPREAQERLRRGFEEGEYATPTRTGVAYMLSPLVRAYGRTERDATVGTFNFPHYMLYAPDVSGEELGLLMRPSMPDPHGMIVVLAGEAERQAYTKENAEMLSRLCALHDPWCVS